MQARSSTFQRAENPAQRATVNVRIHPHYHPAGQHDLNQTLGP